MRTVLITFVVPVVLIGLGSLIIALDLKFSPSEQGHAVFDFANTDWWLYLHPFPGLVMVYATIVFYPYIGISGVTMCLNAGQLVMSLIFDNFGLLTFAVKPATLLRVTGVVFVCVAAIALQLVRGTLPARQQSSESSQDNGLVVRETDRLLPGGTNLLVRESSA